MGVLAEHPTTSWEAMQDGAVFYSKRQLYSMQWNVHDLSDFIIAGARFGGPLALMRDNSKLIAMGRTTFTRPQIQVYSSAGALLMTLNWELGKIVRFGWTIDEELVVLNEEGVYRTHDLQGDYRQFSLGSEAAETGVLDARIWENGLVALTGALALLEVKGWQGSKPLTLATAHLTQPPFAWAVIPPDQTTSRHVEVLLSIETTILTVDNLECIDQQLGRGPFSHIAPSPNGKSLALMTATGVLWVVSSDFQKKVAEYNTSEAGATGQPRDVGWCGNDAIIVNWDSLVLVVGPYGETLKHYYISPTYLVPEIDGIRIFSAENCDFLHRVPASSEKVFRPGSISPAAILYDAADHFDRRSPKADENIRSIKPDLASAVDVCVEAAGQEWEATWQRKLLNAAKFGRAFLDLFNPTEFVEMGKTLRILNAMHYYEVGIPITLTQYNYTSPDQLLARLTSRSLHLLALRVASHLSIKPDAILKHWACAKIARSKPSAGVTADGGDDEVCKLIVEKFETMGGGGSGVSYAEIAKRAWEVGRTGLATKLLDHETRAAEQVPLLLGMKEDRRALEKAVDSGDTDLVYHVLLQLHKRLSLGDFFRLIEGGGPKLEPASRLLQVYAREQNRGMLRDFYYSEDRRVESGLLLLEEASSMTDLTARTTSVKAAQKFFSEDTQRAFEARMMDESARLLAFQQVLEKDTDGKVKFVGVSINETIIRCLTAGLHKRADKVRADWKVPDKRFWHLKLRALTETKDWEGLDAFAKSKKSPIGYEPFARHLAEKGFGVQGAQYVPRCDAAKRSELYAICGEWRLAGKEAKERGDKAALTQLKTTCPDALIARELDQLLNSM